MKTTKEIIDFYKRNRWHYTYKKKICIKCKRLCWIELPFEDIFLSGNEKIHWMNDDNNFTCE